MSAFRDVVQDMVGRHVVRTSSGDWDEPALRSAFAELAEQGWTRVGLPEGLGGNGGGFADAAEAVTAAAYQGVPTPLADQVLVTNAVATRLGIPLPEECVVPVIAKAGRAARVPWASWASHLLVADREGGVGLVEAGAARVTNGANLAGLPADTVLLDVSPPGTGGAEAATLIEGYGALARGVQIAAALERCRHLTVTYLRQRKQFGRPLATQPVVRQELAALAGEAAAAAAAARTAVSNPRLREIAAAKVRTGLAATTGARIAHQLHGAMGITREYELQVHTRSMWAWRDEYGSERIWAARLGSDIRESEDDLWTAVVPASL
ncbi:acyl-CoA dehydrogenase family protein [Amycolatopsis sp. NPDC005232]|uniref:acyl-CoA dehydrogenase family protein n=1 Tax=Amycolatopsis sp. NPDC005232 TaxID=3157027 RepID=UPI0033A0AAF1